MSGHKRVWAQSCLGTNQMCLGTNMSRHSHVCAKSCGAQSCLSAIMPGHKRVWAQTCVGTKVSGHSRVGPVVWTESCMGTNVVEPHFIGHQLKEKREHRYLRQAGQLTHAIRVTARDMLS